MQQSAGWHYKKTTLEGKKEPAAAQGGEAASGPHWLHIKPMEGQKAERARKGEEWSRRRGGMEIGNGSRLE